MKYIQFFSFGFIFLFFISCEKDEFEEDSDPYQPPVVQQQHFGEELLALVNQVRASGCNCGVHGYQEPVGPLSSNPLLNQAAQMHANDMWGNHFFNHEGSNGSMPWDRVAHFGYNYSHVGENIAKACGDNPADAHTEQTVFDAWMASDGHCRRLMMGEYTEMGIAKKGALGSGTNCEYWVQDFGAPE